MEEIVFRGKNDQAVTSSLLVAEKFEKSHDNVLKAIRKILDDGIVKNDETPMFEETTYVNEQNRQTYPMFLMNRDGFSLLVMGFTGKKAMQFKLDYIKAFNNMEAEIKSAIKPKTQLEILQISINQLVEQEHRLSNVERDVADEGTNPIIRDVVVVNVNDGCDKEIETLLSKQDCIELMAYLSAATFALRD